ncbi:MAG: LuxR C-terminal-related transcriptional regulator [Candidatus Acidiferrum sp.]
MTSDSVSGPMVKSDNAPWIEAPAPAFREIFGAATPGLATVLNNSTVGVEIYDSNLCCILKNRAFAAMGGTLSEIHIGKTMRQIFGSYSAQIEPAFRQAWTTGKPVSNVELAFSLPWSPGKTDLVVNFYPIEDVCREVRLIAALFFSATGKRKLQQRLCHLAEKKRALDFAESEYPGEEFADLTTQSAEMLRKSIDLLHRSMSLRCHLVEMRIATALMYATPYSATSASSSPRFLPAVPPRVEFEEDRREEPELSRAEENDGCIPSPRERQVIQLLAEGKANKEMAAVLELSTRTVEMYRARLMAKLKLHSVAELVRYAVRHNLIEA